MPSYHIENIDRSWRMILLCRYNRCVGLLMLWRIVAGMSRGRCGSFGTGFDDLGLSAQVCNQLQVSQPPFKAPGKASFSSFYHGVGFWLLPFSFLIVSNLQVNNAGVTLKTPSYTAEGVGGSAQVSTHQFVSILIILLLADWSFLFVKFRDMLRCERPWLVMNDTPWNIYDAM